MRILGYHRIADAGDSLAVSPARFREQMRAVAESGAQPIRLDRAIELLRSPVPGRYVCVTFDDGYRDNLLAAAPVLAEFDIPATIFLPSRIIDGEVPFHWYEEPPPALSWDEVGELVAGGLVDVQSHTLTHPLLPQVDARALVRGDRGLEARDRGARPLRAHELLLPGRPLRRARGRVRARGRLRRGGDHQSRRQQRAAASCSSCGARSSTAPTTCACSGPSSTALLDGETVLRRALHARRSRAA